MRNPQEHNTASEKGSRRDKGSGHDKGSRGDQGSRDPSSLGWTTVMDQVSRGDQGSRASKHGQGRMNKRADCDTRVTEIRLEGILMDPPGRTRRLAMPTETDRHAVATTRAGRILELQAAYVLRERIQAANARNQRRLNGEETR